MPAISALEREQRIHQMLVWVTKGSSRQQCLRLAQDEWGIRERQAESYYAWVRERIQADLDAARPTMTAEHVARLRMIYDKALAKDSLGVALQALAQEAKLLGLDAAQKVEVSTPVEPKTEAEVLAALGAARASGA